MEKIAYENIKYLYVYELIWSDLWLKETLLRKPK